MKAGTRRPSPALIVAMIALCAALAGTATALPGRNTIDKNDIQKGAVTKKALKKGAVTKKAIKKRAVTQKAIKDGAVTAAKIAAGAVGSAAIADGSVAAADLADAEAPRLVGTAGQPPFETGGDGDCIWRNVNSQPGAEFAAPASFYKDTDGRVHLSGVVAAEDGPGGDGACGDNGGNDGDRDATVFVLPPGYRPASVEFFGDITGAAVAIVNDADLTIPGNAPVPAGAVAVTAVPGQPALLGGISFRAAGPATAKAVRQAGPVRASRGLFGLAP